MITLETFMRTHRRLLASTLLATVGLLGAVPASAQHAAPADNVLLADISAKDAMGGTLKTEKASAIQSMILDGWLEEELAAETEAGVLTTARAAYAQNVFQPIWTEKGVRSLKRARADLFSYGLAAADVSGANLDQIAAKRFKADSDEVRATADLQLTAAWLRMASAVSGGLADNGEAAKSREDAPSKSVLQKSLIKAARGDADDILADLEPEHPQYNRLKKQLKHYREIRATGGWLAIPDGDAIELGDQDPRVPALRDRLEAEGYYTPETWAGAILSTISMATNEDADTPPPEVVFDARLQDSLKDFQRHHGLEDDGVVGGNTLAALNESVESKIDRIADTMTRWRHYDDLGDQYIWANIPSFMAEGWRNGRREIAMKTIVGMPSRETPVFSDEVEYAVANPRWYAPVSIVRRDKLPKLARDPSYAARKNFTVIERATGQSVSAASVDWTDPASAQDYQLVQGPGASNALGDLKIIFPNQYSVYLHGTPGKSLFDKAERTFSSGCVRLEKPADMAKWIASHDPEVSTRDVTKALAGSDPERIEFKTETRIHITYMTVTVDEDGAPNFWRDVYQEDDGIMMVDKYAPLYQPTLDEELAQATTTPRKG
jgi:L,D-transpeptidase YcbB